MIEYSYFSVRQRCRTHRETDTEREKDLLWQSTSTDGFEDWFETWPLAIPYCSLSGKRSNRHAASAGTQSLEAMATGDSRTVEECFLEECFTMFSYTIPHPDNFERAKAICQSSKPVTMETPQVEDVKDPGECIYNSDSTSRLVMKVTPKKGSESTEQSEAGPTVLKLHKIHPAQHRYEPKMLYKELLITMYVQRCEEKIRQEKMDRLIATCKPIWYKFSSCEGFEMDYFAEGTLGQLSRTLRHDNERLGLLRDAASGLHFLNSLHIIHFDVKPSNICVSMRADGTRVAKWIDLGSAKFTGEKVDRCNLTDTVAYRPPELFPRPGIQQTEDFVLVNSSADFWRFGLCILEVMTRKSFPPLWSKALMSNYMYEQFIRMNDRQLKRGLYEPLKFPLFPTSNLPECVDRLLFYLLRLDGAARMNMEHVTEELNKHLVLANVSPLDDAGTSKVPSAIKPAGSSPSNASKF